MADGGTKRADRTAARVSFTLPESVCPIVAHTGSGDRTFYLEGFVSRGDERYTAFFRVTGTDLDGSAERADDGTAGRDAGVDARCLERRENAALVAVDVGVACPTVFLAEAGAFPRTISADDGDVRIHAAVPPTEDPGDVVAGFLDAYDEADLRSKYDDPEGGSLLADLDPAVRVADRLTGRQKEVLAVAHEAGYYEWPRSVTAEELADRLDVTPATVHKHLRAVERKLVTTFYDERWVRERS